VNGRIPNVFTKSRVFANCGHVAETVLRKFRWEIAMLQMNVVAGVNEPGGGDRTTPARCRSKLPWCAIKLSIGLLVGTVGLAIATAVHASDADDRRILGDLDTKYQKAVEQNDAKTMADILADDFVLVEGDGKKSTKADLVNDAKSGKTHYVRQDDSERTIVVIGDTGVVTAKLRATGIEDGVKVDYSEWFTDVYVRTPKGWRYFYAQASLSLPGNAQQ
jgi:ketosteroid isomerase-like protein